MCKMTAERVSWPQQMFFFTVFFPDMGGNECANHVSFH